MSIRIEGLDEMQELMLRIESETKRRAVGAMIESANELAALARQMAPVDLGNLEDAIKVEVSPERNSLGQFARRTIEVYVDLNAAADEKKLGKTVGDYAYYVHEHMTPLGPVPLGRRSLAKQRASGGIIVGGGYLERAAAQLADKTIDKVSRAARDYLKG